MSDYTQAIKNQAVAMNGQTVVVNLSGGQSLTGTLAYTTTPRYYSTDFPDVLTVTVASKAHTVRVDHISSIGQG
ncbi:hypothetical protein ACFY71_36355 [Streptomyces cinerochromogenes]|uniref:hypothetical protein n=1 Tax=Streptomyces cinerochromogenes TaxID=66422 RepID=UPI0036CB9009